MAEAQTQMQEENDHDDVADKAAQIGKDIGVEKAGDGKEVLPDYEITEDDGEDERIAKERAPAAKTERKQLSNKEKRDLRKKRLAEKFNEKDGIIQSQQEKLDRLEQWKNEVEGRLSNVDKGKVDDAMAQIGNAYNKAKADYTSAFTEGDGEKAATAMAAMYEHQRKYEDLQKLKQQYEKAAPAKNQPNGAVPDQRVIIKAKAWAEKHDWYNPSGTDEDSEIAKSISQVLANEGFDPKTDDFWEELDDRLEKRGIGTGDDEDDEVEEKPKMRKRASPPVSGGSNRGDVAGKVKINLPTAYVKTLKDNGLWDDVPKRNRLIAAYLKNQKELQAAT